MKVQSAHSFSLNDDYSQGRHWKVSIENEKNYTKCITKTDAEYRVLLPSWILHFNNINETTQTSKVKIVVD